MFANDFPLPKAQDYFKQVQAEKACNAYDGRFFEKLFCKLTNNLFKDIFYWFFTFYKII